MDYGVANEPERQRTRPSANAVDEKGDDAEKEDKLEAYVVQRCMTPETARDHPVTPQIEKSGISPIFYSLRTRNPSKFEILWSFVSLGKK